MTRVRILLAVMMAIGAPATVARAGEAQPVPFALGDLVVVPGAVGHGVLPVPAGVDPATEIPITVVHGARPGPVLALIAGVHGAEITPILALQAWTPRVDPAALRGTVVVVRIANLEAFFARSVRVNPVDRKNLNRVFPGRADGTVTERIAHVLSTQVVPRATAVVDIHSGDAHEDLRPWTGYYARLGSREVIERSRAMAAAFGVPWVVQFPFAPGVEEPSVYTGVVAVRLGIPAFDVEVGRLGNVEPDLVELVATGLDRLTRHLGMRDGPVPPTPDLRYVKTRASVNAETTGIFHGRVRAGEDVAAGTLIGEITDVHGRVRQRIEAPAAGHVLFVLATPAVSRGEPVLTLATQVAQEP